MRAFRIGSIFPMHWATWGVALALGTSLAQAGPFDWLSPDWWRPQPTVVYSPVVPPPTTAVRLPVTTMSTTLLPPASVATVTYAPVAQTCYYAPETRYRWVYGRMPVTSYRPVTVVDPCTGAISTSYQPVTRLTLLPWLHREPYTTYRLVCTPGIATTVTETSYVVTDPCAPIVESAPLGTYAPSSSCPPGCVPAPGTTVTPGPTEAPGPTDSGYGAPKTFKESTAPSAATSSPYSVQRPAENSPTSAAPSSPNNGGSSTPNPTSPGLNHPQVIQPSSTKSASLVTPQASPRVPQQVVYTASATSKPGQWHNVLPQNNSSPETAVDTGGWRPARQK
jgi:hypothetical protein